MRGADKKCQPMKQNHCSYLLRLSAEGLVMLLTTWGFRYLGQPTIPCCFKCFKQTAIPAFFCPVLKPSPAPEQAATSVPPEGRPQRSLAWVKSGENAPVGPAFLRLGTKAAMVAVLRNYNKGESL
jgi:hypothetical protein